MATDSHPTQSDGPPPFVDFIAPFCSGWLARREHPEAENDPEAFMRLANEAYQRSGPFLAWNVATGQMDAEEARAILHGDLTNEAFGV